MDEWGPLIGALGGIVAAAVTGWLVIGRARVEARAPQEASAVEGFDRLTERLEGEVARLAAALEAERLACKTQLDSLNRQVQELRREIAALRADGADRRRRNDGPPHGGPERRAT